MKLEWIKENGGEDAQAFFESAIGNMLDEAKQQRLVSKEMEEPAVEVTETPAEPVVETPSAEVADVETSAVADEGTITKGTSETIVVDAKLLGEIVAMVQDTVLKSLTEYHNQAFAPLAAKVEALSTNVEIVKSRQADTKPLFDLSPPAAIAQMVKERFAQHAGDIVEKELPETVVENNYEGGNSFASTNLLSGI